MMTLLPSFLDHQRVVGAKPRHSKKYVAISSGRIDAAARIIRPIAIDERARRRKFRSCLSRACAWSEMVGQKTRQVKNALNRLTAASIQVSCSCIACLVSKSECDGPINAITLAGSRSRRRRQSRKPEGLASTDARQPQQARLKTGITREEGPLIGCFPGNSVPT
jgi:hypothetical protein